MGAQGSDKSLLARFTVLIGVVITAVLLVNLALTFQTRQNEAESKALAEARVLNAEMQAVWDYINAQQDLINYNSDGTYDFKGVYCTIAAKNVARRFMRESDYIIRYARENPRSATDEPDEFEQRAIEAWRTTGQTEYYDVTTFEGETALRYATVLLTKTNCLGCHGEPAGELDVTGFVKEGFELNDLAGVSSIVIPMGVYQDEIIEGVLHDFALLTVLVTIVALAIWFCLQRWVTGPLGRMRQAANMVAKGNFDTSLSLANAHGEIRDLTRSFSTMAQELRVSHESLELQVRERTNELEEANERLKQMNTELQEANAAKSNFLAIVSHELRTPLASIIAFSEILSHAPGTGKDERCMVQEISHNGTQLLDMINNLIDTARIEAGKFQISIGEVDVIDVVMSVEHVMEPLAAKKSIKLKSSIDASVPVIRSDFDALRKILINLVGNAVKFTGEGGNVEIRGRVDREGGLRDGDRLVLEVEDDGEGIDPDAIPTIFDRFVQVDASISRTHGGSGLGLSLVKDLVGELGGTVEVSSAVGAGSTFTVTLPLVRAEDPVEGTGDKIAEESDGDAGSTTGEEQGK